MLGLFFDTSFATTLGLFDENYSWIDKLIDSDTRSSNKIQKKIDEILKRNNLEIDAIDTFIYCAGPGSYTGLRVSHGIAEFIKSENNKKVYSFYHHEMALNNSSDGIFISKAFKGEYFVCDGKNNGNSYFIKDADVISLINSEKDNRTIYTHYLNSLDKKILDLCGEAIIETQSLFFKKPDFLLKIIKDKMQRPLFYYRTIDQEFNKPKS